MPTKAHWTSSTPSTSTLFSLKRRTYFSRVPSRARTSSSRLLYSLFPYIPYILPCRRHSHSHGLCTDCADVCRRVSSCAQNFRRRAKKRVEFERIRTNSIERIRSNDDATTLVWSVGRCVTHDHHTVSTYIFIDPSSRRRSRPIGRHSTPRETSNDDVNVTCVDDADVHSS